MFSYIKLVLIVVLALVFAGGLYYVTELKANLAIAKENQAKLENAVEQQKEALESMKADVEAQQKINSELQKVTEKQMADMTNLQKKLEANRLSNMALSKPEVVQEKMNRGTVNAVRCIELATGAPFNEKEKAAKTAKEFNNECPNYWPGVVTDAK